MFGSTLLIFTALIGQSGTPTVSVTSPTGPNSVKPSTTTQYVGVVSNVTFPAGTPGSTPVTVQIGVLNQNTGQKTSQTYNTTVAGINNVSFAPLFPAGSTGDPYTLLFQVNYTNLTGNAVQGSGTSTGTYGRPTSN